MTTLKLHYEGWLALPSPFRQKLSLSTGAALEAELVDGTIVLRPLSTGRGSAGREQEAIEPPVDLASPAPSPRTEAPATREMDRTRKDPGPGLPDQVSQPKRPRGRPRKAEVKPEPEPAPPPVPAEPWKLLRKADRPVVAASDSPAPAPDRRPIRPTREAAPEHEREERRPFRNVEIRNLGPGRGHNRPRTSHSWPPSQQRG